MKNIEMQNEETISWIFLAISIASQSSPATFDGICQIADGINHAVPTQKEMQNSISWLISSNLILKTEKKYTLSESGKDLYEQTQNQSNLLMEMWKYLEIELTKKKNDSA